MYRDPPLAGTGFFPLLMAARQDKPLSDLQAQQHKPGGSLVGFAAKLAEQRLANEGIHFGCKLTWLLCRIMLLS